MLETANKPPKIPSPWEELTFSELSGTMMIIGQSAVGKSTLARHLLKRLSRIYLSVPRCSLPSSGSKNCLICCCPCNQEVTSWF
jgi:hypothetical protein